MEDSLIYFGGEVKALGEGKVGGYLVRYSTPKDPDLESDFFSKDSDLGVEANNTLPVYYHHGMDGTLKSRKIGKAITKYDDVGLWLEAQLEMRDEYEKRVYELVEAGKLGWSSGAAGHLVEREQVGKAWHIKSWPIGEASLTPTPAEPRNGVMPIKSLLEPVIVQAENPTEENIMEKDTEVKNEAPQLDIAEMMRETAKAAAAEAVKAYEAAQPQVKAGVVDVIVDEADKALKENPFTGAEFFKAVHKAAIEPYGIDKRLKALKASGLNEAIPSEGGFLVPDDIAAGITQNMWTTGAMLSRFSPVSVSGAGLRVNAIDETSRVNGSRTGGLLSYWLEEGGTKTATKPKFRQLSLRLKKVAAALYATDELLDDAVALNSWIVNNVPNELVFRVEDAIMNGTGAGMPLGILAAPCLVEAARTDADEIDSLGVSHMWARRYPGSNDYVWFANASIVPQLYNMTLGDQPIYMPPGGIADAPYGRLLGRPVIETEYNPELGDVGDLLLASPSQYAMITKGGVQSASSIHVQFLTDETTFRFVYRCDGQPYWNSAMTPFKGTDTISPFVALAATT